jgi:nickel-dependent lactate racemase
MQVEMAYGQEKVALQVTESNVLTVQRQPQPAPVNDPAAAVREALESPYHFPPLRRALTPDDHVAIVVDEQLPGLANLLAPILEHLTEAQVHPDAVTLVCPTPAASQPWLDGLPEEFEEVRVEVHDSSDRDHLSYLASTRRGRRVYLNRTVTDADQVVVLGRRGYDSLTGYSGAETALFPSLSDEATLRDVQKQLTLRPPGQEPWPLEREAAEVAWLLGAPFLVQVIEGVGSEVLHVLGGTLDSSSEGRRLLDSAWRVQLSRRASVVVAGISGDAGRHRFTELAQALANAARVVEPGGRIILLTDTAPELGLAARVLREANDSRQALRLLSHETFAGRDAAFQWASAAEVATIYLLSRLEPDIAEELFTVPLEDAGQAQRLLVPGQSLVFLPEAHKMMASVKDDE